MSDLSVPPEWQQLLGLLTLHQRAALNVDIVWASGPETKPAGEWNCRIQTVTMFLRPDGSRRNLTHMVSESLATTPAAALRVATIDMLRQVKEERERLQARRNQ